MKDILLTTDIGSDIDDALALNVIVNSGLPLRALYAVNGKVDVRAAIAKHMADLSGKDFAVATGSSHSMSGKEPYTYFEDAHVPLDFYEGSSLNLKGPEELGIIKDGTEDLASRLAGQEHVLFSIGPLTTIAQVLKDKPEVSGNIARLYVMGGRFDTASLEHNIYYDVDAANIVFSSEVPITVIPGDLCEQVRLPVDQLHFTTPQGLYVKQMADSFIGTKIALNLNSTNAMSLLEQVYEIPSTAVDRAAFIKRFDFRKKASGILGDVLYAANRPKEYLDCFDRYVNDLKEATFNFVNREAGLEILEAARPESLSIADVFVPYCYAHPDMLRTENHNVLISSGKSLLNSGSKHSIVTHIDHHHFMKYVKEYLR